MSDTSQRATYDDDDGRTISADDVRPRVDENIIAVGGVLGTTHIGESDPIEDIPLHVDGASGAFVTPFSEPDLTFDFRLEQVASINAWGHKYGLVYPGVGWLIMRDVLRLGRRGYTGIVKMMLANDSPPASAMRCRPVSERRV